MDAQAVAQLSARVFQRHVFRKSGPGWWWTELGVDASWEWADPETKQAAVEAVLGLLEATPKLWNLLTTSMEYFCSINLISLKA